MPPSFLDEVAHRPWPLPHAPWIMRQRWHDLLLAHWAVDARALRPRVPASLPLDLYDGMAWIGVVPFWMTNVAPRGVPALPFVSSFAELNVRTYVTVDGKPGVYFFSLDAASMLAVAAARALFGLPYFAATMQVTHENGDIRYRSVRRRGGDAAFAAEYRPVGPAREAVRGSIEHFLAERYCLYTVTRGGAVRRLDIHHRPWPLQPAEAAIATNTMAAAAGISLPAVRPLLHYARQLDMVGWWPSPAGARRAE